jgi:hypothetical protein
VNRHHSDLRGILSSIDSRVARQQRFERALTPTRGDEAVGEELADTVVGKRRDDAGQEDLKLHRAFLPLDDPAIADLELFHCQAAAQQVQVPRLGLDRGAVFLARLVLDCAAVWLGRFIGPRPVHADNLRGRPAVAEPNGVADFERGGLRDGLIVQQRLVALAARRQNLSRFPHAQAAVVEFNKQGGLSHGKVTRCLDSLFGIRLSRGGSVHTVLRAARRCEPVYESIRQTVGQSDSVVPDETGWRVGGHPAWLHTVVREQATAYVIDPTRSGAVAEDILGLDYDGTMIHDGWSPYDRFEDARHQQCLNHLLRRRADEMVATATRGAVCFPRRVAELLRAGLALRDRHAAGEISPHGLAVARGRLENQLSDLIFPPRTNAANERLAQHLWAHRDQLLTFLRQPGLNATNWRAELAIRFGVLFRKVWGGNRTWAGARAQSVLMSVWRTCWQQGRSAVDFLSQLLRGPPPPGCATPGLDVCPADAAVALPSRS